MMRIMEKNRAFRKGMVYALCTWLVIASPVTVKAETETETGAPAETAAPAPSGDSTTASGGSQTESEEIVDEEKNAQLGSDTLRVEEYQLFRPESSNNTLDTLYKGRSARLMVTVQSNTLTTGDVKAKDILVSKDRDSYRTTGSPVVKITSKKGENLVFHVIFPKITYNGKDTSFGFGVKYRGSGMEAIPLSIDITEAEESDYSGSGSGDGEESATAQPIVKVERVGNPQPVGAGEKIELTLRLVNTSKAADVEDLMVSFTPGGSMYLMDDTNSRVIKRLNTGKSTEIKINLQAGQDLSGASQSLDVEMKYNYFSANRLTNGTSVQKVMIPVKGNSASGQPLIQITRVGGVGTVRAGEQFQTVIRIENTSQNKDISGLMATVEPTEQIALMDATDTRLIGELKAGQSVDLPVLLKASSELSSSASQLIGVSLKFDYDSGKGVTQGTLSGKIVIPTDGSAAKIGVPTPNIIIRNYSYGGNVEAGQVFDLVMEVANTSTTSAVENVLMSMDTGEGLSINDSSNTIYIPSLAPGATTTRTVRVQALFQSKLQSPKLGISFKYEFLDKKERKQNTTNEAIAIPVYQPDRLEVRPPSFTDTIRVNEEAVISVPYANKGRGQIFNVEAKLEGEVDVLERQLSLGNFESGKNGSIDFVATPRSQGKFEGKVIISYEDEAMKKKEIEVPVTFDVQEESVNTEAQAPAEQKEPKGIPLWLPVAGILVIAGAAALFIRKKRRSRTEQQPDDEESCEAWEDDVTDDVTDEEVEPHEE